MCVGPDPSFWESALSSRCGLGGNGAKGTVQQALLFTEHLATHMTEIH